MAAHLFSPPALIRTAFRAIDAIVYPPACLACGVITARHGALCAACWNTVRFIERPYCEVTGLPFGHDRGEGAISLAALADPPAYSRARAAVLHEGVARKLAHGLKYSDRADLAPVMAAWMERAGRDVIAGCDLIVPVPLHRVRLFARRYNQAAELARALARLCGKPMASGILFRRKATRRQVGLGRNQRRENVRAAFLVDPGGRAAISGRRILLVDDVLTTGATVDAAASTLLRAGAAEVSVLTFARVASEGAETLYA